MKNYINKKKVKFKYYLITKKKKLYTFKEKIFNN